MINEPQEIHEKCLQTIQNQGRMFELWHHFRFAAPLTAKNESPPLNADWNVINFRTRLVTQLTCTDHQADTSEYLSSRDGTFLANASYPPKNAISPLCKQRQFFFNFKIVKDTKPLCIWLFIRKPWINYQMVQLFPVIGIWQCRNRFTKNWTLIELVSSSRSDSYKTRVYWWRKIILITANYHGIHWDTMVKRYIWI